jgi:hypothetical protein
MTMTEDQQRAFYDALARDRTAGPRIGLDTPEHVAEHAAKIGGELALRVAIARGDFTLTGAAVAQAWVDQQERERSNAHAHASIVAAERSARAAEHSARYTMIAAFISLVAAVVSLGGEKVVDFIDYAYSRMPW